MTVVASTFEDADLAGVEADLVVGATSFHWVRREEGMRRAARPSPARRPRRTVVDSLLRPLPPRPLRRRHGPPLAHRRGQFDEPGRPEFQVDVEHRCSDLINGAGLVDVRAEVAHWEITLTTRKVCDLYASMAAVRRRPASEQAAIVAELARIAEEEFAGAVARPFVTAFYSGRRPA